MSRWMSRWLSRWLSRSWALRRRRIAPGDEGRHDKTPRAFLNTLAEAQVASGRIRDFAAGGRDDGVAGRDVPFAGWRQPRIDIDRTLRDLRQFDRRAEPLADRAGPGVDKGFGRGVAMRTAHRRDPGFSGRRKRPGADRLRRPASIPTMSGHKPLGTLTDQAAPDQSECRRPDDAEQRHSIGHQSQIDREFVAAGDEFLGAVQGIDQEECAWAVLWAAAASRRYALFRQRRNIRRQPGKALGDDAVGGQVRFRYRRAIGFAVDTHPRAIHFEDRRTGECDELGQGRHQAGYGPMVDRRG